MVNRLIQPFFAFVDATGAPRENYRLFFYAANTSTKLNTYSATDLTLNANPLTLNSLGQCPTDVFGQDLAYDIVLALPGSNDPPTGSEVATYVDVSTSDFTARAKFSAYNGDPNTHVAGTAGTGSTPADAVWDYTNRLLYMCTTTGVAAAAVWTAINSSTAVNVVPPPTGRLTLTSGAPVLTTGVVSATSVYWAPFTGNLTPLYNGSIFVPTTFTERTLSFVASHTANSIYDVFAFSDSGVFTIGTGPGWTTPTAGAGVRGTGAGTTELTLINGLWVNAVQITARNGSTTYTVAANRGTYLGSISMDGTNGQVTCHTAFGQSRKWGVWNAYNRQLITLRAGDATASWVYNTATIRPSNNNAANGLLTFVGLPEESVNIDFVQGIAIQNTSTGSGNIAVSIGIGVGSTTAYTGKNGNVLGWQDGAVTVAQVGGDCLATHTIDPHIGLLSISCLERSQSKSNLTVTYQGSSANMVMTAQWEG